jgi:glycosyltransferase involved in cell wall biosynthesis
MKENYIFKVLLVSPSPPPVGGIATWSLNILKYYSEKRTNWQIIHQNSSSKNTDITNVSNWRRLYKGIKESRRLLSEYRKKIDTVKPDVIHISSSASFALFKDILLLRIAAKRKIPVITHFHFGRIPQLDVSKNWEWQLLCSVIRKSKMAIVIDDKSYQTLLRAGFKNIKNVPNPISIELEAMIRSQLDYVSERRKGSVVFVGHVERNKGVFELVEACSILKINELLIVGPYEIGIKNELLKLSRKRDNGSWLKFYGSLNESDVLNHLRNASMMVLPSYTEGFPIVVTEAMSMGCPVIATDVGAISEMLDIKSDHSCGICVSPKNIEELSSALLTLMNDPEKAKEMGLNGVNRVLANYTFTSLSLLYEQVWMNALTERSSTTTVLDFQTQGAVE